MSRVKKLLFSILFIAVLEGVKRILNEQVVSFSFYYNLFSCIQVAVLIWAVFALIIKKTWISIAVFLGFMVVMEITCSILIYRPGLIPRPLMPAFHFYYDHFDCRLIQYEGGSEFDSILYYKLKKNNDFLYQNAEFSDSFHVNSVSLRDDEQSLLSPEIICVGDSYTLGWGSEQQQTFPQLIENKSGMKVLNVSMSSYGTAREIKLLQKVDLSKVKFILWQYCFNDAEENNAFLKDSNFIDSRKSYDSVVALHEWTRKYFPGKHFLTLIKLAISQRGAKRFNGGESTNIDDAKNFLRVLSGLSIDTTRIKIIVFELGPREAEKGIVKNLRRINTNQNFYPLNVDSLLKNEDYYLLDVHLRKTGHEKVAESLLTEMKNLTEKNLTP